MVACLSERAGGIDLSLVCEDPNLVGWASDSTARRWAAIRVESIFRSGLVLASMVKISRPTRRWRSRGDPIPVSPMGYRVFMLCLACREVCRGDVCPRCVQSFRGAPDRWVEPGLVVRSAFAHEGPARALVHRLKYDGIVEAAMVLASSMNHLLADATALVPVPRTVTRRHRYGVDPGAELARAIGRSTALPVVGALCPALIGRKHAGVRKSERRAPTFRLSGSVPTGAVLVDDVITTGVTLQQAARTTGLRRAVTATSRGMNG